jgi:hypothetical protein
MKYESLNQGQDWSKIQNQRQICDISEGRGDDGAHFEPPLSDGMVVSSYF